MIAAIDPNNPITINPETNRPNIDIGLDDNNPILIDPTTGRPILMSMGKHPGS